MAAVFIYRALNTVTAAEEYLISRQEVKPGAVVEEAGKRWEILEIVERG